MPTSIPAFFSALPTEILVHIFSYNLPVRRIPGVPGRDESDAIETDKDIYDFLGWLAV